MLSMVLCLFRVSLVFLFLYFNLASSYKMKVFRAVLKLSNFCLKSSRSTPQLSRSLFKEREIHVSLPITKALFSSSSSENDQWINDLSESGRSKVSAVYEKACQEFESAGVAEPQESARYLLCKAGNFGYRLSDFKSALNIELKKGRYDLLLINHDHQY